MVAAARRKLELLGLTPEEIGALRVPSASTVVRAPIGGTVIDKQVIKGAQVNPGDVLFTVAVLDPIWITADIYEDDLARVRPGQELEAETPAFPDRIFRGVIGRVSPNFDPTTHTAQLRCQVRNPGLALKPDMLARVRILTAPGRVTLVSQDALIFEVDALLRIRRSRAGPRDPPQSNNCLLEQPGADPRARRPAARASAW